MKAVLISIQPKWVEKIANGKKTIEVRKTAPKNVPFKAYIYCTTGKPYLYRVDDDDNFELTNTLRQKIDEYVKDYNAQNGKIIGEFVCGKIEDFKCASVPYKKENNLGYGHFVDNGVYKVNGWFEGVVFERNDKYIDTMLKNKELSEMCLSAQQLFDYIGIGKHFYGWHISDLKIYDKPKELSEFFKPCPTKEKGDCLSCDCLADNDYGGICTNNLTRAPQSWQYVEEL